MARKRTGMEILRDIPYGPHGERNMLDLYLPEKAPGPRPLVVCIHGGGWTGGDKSAFGWIGERLAARGIAAASIHYRFWPQWPCPAAMDDAQRAVRWLRKNAATYGLDASRVGAIGGSAGAHLATYLALAPLRDDSDPELAGFSSHVGCVVDCYGPVDFMAMMSTASAPIVEGFMGAPLTPETEPAYRAASPMFFVRPVPPPFLIVHGTADVGTQMGQVPLTISERFCEALRRAGGGATLVPLEGGPHGFSGNPESPYAQAMWEVALPFLERHLMTETPAGK